jgi:hypothetical protein
VRGRGLTIPAGALAQCEDARRPIPEHSGQLSHLRFLLKCPEDLDLQQKTASSRTGSSPATASTSGSPDDWFGRLFVRFRRSKEPQQPHPSSQLVGPEAGAYFAFAGAVVARAMIHRRSPHRVLPQTSARTAAVPDGFAIAVTEEKKAQSAGLVVRDMLRGRIVEQGKHSAGDSMD